MRLKFADMSPLQKRKAIARDALARLASRQLKPKKGNWVTLHQDVLPMEDGSLVTDLQKLLKLKKPCEACALGGAICGLARFEDKIDVKQACPNTFEASFNRNAETSNRLQAIFGRGQLVLMEAAFENFGGWYRKYDVPDPAKVEAFCKRYKSYRGRFKAIFTQIAKTGEFNP